MQSIQSHGFKPMEVQLLYKQVKIANSILHVDWRYLGEGNDAKLVLSKENIKLGAASTLVLVGESRHKQAAPYLDMPIRLMQLVALLKENTAVSLSNARAILHLMSSKTYQSLTLDCAMGPVMLEPQKGVVRCALESFPALIRCLSKTDNLVFLTKKQVAEDCPSQFPACASLKKVLWHLAKTETSFSLLRWDNTCRYQLKTWPRISEWDASANMLKLAIVFSRQATSITKAAKLCSASETEVKVFLHCCETMGMQIYSEEEPGTAILKDKQTAARGESQGWLNKKFRELLH